MPGTRLHRLASRFFTAAVLQQIIEPTLADLQHECGLARSSSTWRRTWIYVRAYWCFWRVAIIQLAGILLDGRDEAPIDPQLPWRMLGGGIAAVVVVTAIVVLAAPLSILGSLKELRTAFNGHIQNGLMLLVPSAIPIALPAGLIVATMWSARRGPASRHVRRSVVLFGLCGSLCSAALLEWVIPDANQTFRVAVFHHRDPHLGPPQKGANELTWHELKARITTERRLGRESELRQLQLSYHVRLATASAPFVFAFLAAALLRRPRTRRLMLGAALSVAAYVGYFVLIDFWRLVGQERLSPIAVAWTPNTVAFLLNVVISVSSVFRGKAFQWTEPLVPPSDGSSSI
jgi:lipopolysaccharide export system permease LptF/LptG-like protein